MFYLAPDTFQDSLSIYLRAEEAPVRPSLMLSDFGRFEFLPIEDNHVLFAIDSVFLEGVQGIVQGNVGTSLPFSTWMESIIFLLLMLCIVLFSLVYRNARGTFIDNFKNRLSPLIKQIPRHKGQVTTSELWGELFMICQTLLLIAIFLFIYLFPPDYAPSSPWYYLIGLGVLFLGLALIAGLKYAMYRAIAAFFLSMDLKRWIGQYYQHAQLFGLFLFLPILVFVFLQEYRNIMFVLVLFLFLVNRLVITISLLNIFVKNKVGLLYFFVYLCGTEIAPYLLFYKGALSIVNIAGNYFV